MPHNLWKVMTESAPTKSKPPNYAAGLPNLQMRDDMFQALTAGMEKPDKLRTDLVQAVNELPPSEQAAILARYDRIIRESADGGRMQILITQQNSAPFMPQLANSVAGTITTQTANGKPGNNYIILNSDRLMEALRSDATTNQFIQVVGHEIAHQNNGDLTPSGIIIGGINPAQQIQREIRADVMGALNKRDPDAMAQFLHNIVIDRIPEYNRKHGTRISNPPTEEEFKQMTDQYSRDDPSHPHIMDRIAYLRKQGELMREYERRHPPVDTQAYRNQQADYVVGATMEYGLQLHAQRQNSKTETPSKESAYKQIATIGAELRDAHVTPAQQSTSNLRLHVATGKQSEGRTV